MQTLVLKGGRNSGFCFLEAAVIAARGLNADSSALRGKE